MTKPSKICTKCGYRMLLTSFGQDSRSSDGRRSQCLDCERAAGRKRASLNRAADPEAARQRQRDYWQEIKTKVLTHYGLSCACCGSTNRLSIDHANGDGAEHREELYGNERHGSGWRFYMWLIRNDFPDGYQTLCLRCNRSKDKGQLCTLVHGGPVPVEIVIPVEITIPSHNGLLLLPCEHQRAYLKDLRLNTPYLRMCKTCRIWFEISIQVPRNGTGTLTALITRQHE